jgi:hypothetical protein
MSQDGPCNTFVSLLYVLCAGICCSILYILSLKRLDVLVELLVSGVFLFVVLNYFSFKFRDIWNSLFVS